MKQAAVRTKTISAATPDALDAAIEEFNQTLQEEQRLDFHFAIAPTAPPLYVAVIEYTS